MDKSRRQILTLLLISLLLSTLRIQTGAQSQKLNYPPAKRGVDVDVWHGVTVPDPYRWLEEMNSDETKSWVQAQDGLLQNYLGEPADRAPIRARLTELLRNDSYTVPLKENGRYFFIKNGANSARGQGVLYVQDGCRATPRVVLDVKARFTPDATLSLISPSPNGQYVAYGLRKRQSRWIGMQVLDVEQGADLPDVLTGSHTVSGGVSWTEDSKGFFYSAFELPKAGTEQQAVVRNPKIYYHTLGKPQSEDRLVVALPNEPNAILSHVVTDDGRYVIVAAN